MNQYKIQLDCEDLVETEPQLVRPRMMLELNDVVEYRTNNNDFIPAVFIDMYADDSIKIIPYHSNTTINVSYSQIRRGCKQQIDVVEPMLFYNEPIG
jgi:hypothetical protein